MVRATSPSAQEEEGLFRVLLRKWTVDSVVFGDGVSGDILGSATTPGDQFDCLKGLGRGLCNPRDLPQVLHTFQLIP